MGPSDGRGHRLLLVPQGTLHLRELGQLRPSSLVEGMRLAEGGSDKI